MPGIEASLWIPYTDDGKFCPAARVEPGHADMRQGGPLQQNFEQPSNVRSVYKCFCELSELVHRSLYTLHTPGRILTGPDVTNIYTDFMDWYEKVPVALRLGLNFTPAVLFAQ